MNAKSVPGSRRTGKRARVGVAIRADRGELVQIIGTFREMDHDPKSHSRRVYIVEGRPSGPVFVGLTRELPTVQEIVDALRGR